jgi:hypothetical protein
MLGIACDGFAIRLMESTYPKFSEMSSVWAFLCGVLRLVIVNCAELIENLHVPVFVQDESRSSSCLEFDQLYAEEIVPW